MGEDEIIEIISSALRKLYEKDEYLFLVNANERSITHKLGMYLEDKFQGFDVDCEYNKNGQYPKKLVQFRTQVDSDDTDGVTVYPDIIVHHRGGTDSNANLMVVEVKKSTNPNDDVQKLKCYKNELEYQYAVFIRLVMNVESVKGSYSHMIEIVE